MVKANAAMNDNFQCCESSVKVFRGVTTKEAARPEAPRILPLKRRSVAAERPSNNAVSDGCNISCDQLIRAVNL